LSLHYGNQIIEKSEHKIKRDHDKLNIITKKIFSRNTLLFSSSGKGGVIKSKHKIKRDQDRLIIITKKIFLRNILLFSPSGKGGVIKSEHKTILKKHILLLNIRISSLTSWFGAGMTKHRVKVRIYKILGHC